MRACVGLVILFYAIGLLANPNAANACSVILEPVPYADRIKQLQKPVFAELVRSARFIDLAKITSARKAKKPLQSGNRDPSTLFGTDYHFASLESLKGRAEKEFAYKPQPGDRDYKIPAPIYDNDELFWQQDDWQDSASAWRAKVRHRSSYFWNKGSVFVGDLEGQDMACREYLSFQTGARYLVFRNGDGEFLSAEQIDYDDDAWLLSVRELIKHPTRKFGYSLDLKSFLEVQADPAIIEIKSCGRAPAFSTQHLRTGESEFENGLGRDEVEYYKYIEYPFSRTTCRKGARYFTFDGHLADQWFPINRRGEVELTDIVSQIEVKGTGHIPLSTVREWVALKSPSYDEYSK